MLQQRVRRADFNAVAALLLRAVQRGVGGVNQVDGGRPVLPVDDRDADAGHERDGQPSVNGAPQRPATGAVQGSEDERDEKGRFDAFPQGDHEPLKESSHGGRSVAPPEPARQRPLKAARRAGILATSERSDLPYHGQQEMGAAVPL